MSKRDIIQAISRFEEEMHGSAKDLDFENAALYRDHLKSLREKLEEKA